MTCQFVDNGKNIFTLQDEYKHLIKQLNANGLEKKDGYYPQIMEEIYDWEKEEVEDIIWDAFINKNEVELAPLLPKLDKYDGITILKESPYLFQIPSDASPDTISYVSILSYCKPCPRLYNILADIYINNSNKVNRSTAVIGL